MLKQSKEIDKDIAEQLMNLKYKFPNLLKLTGDCYGICGSLDKPEWNGLDYIKISNILTCIAEDVFTLTNSCKSLKDFDEMTNNAYKVSLIKKYFNKYKIIDCLEHIPDENYEWLNYNFEEHHKSFLESYIRCYSNTRGIEWKGNKRHQYNSDYVNKHYESDYVKKRYYVSEAHKSFLYEKFGTHYDDILQSAKEYHNRYDKNFHENFKFAYILCALVQLPVSSARLIFLQKYIDKIHECEEFSKICINMCAQKIFPVSEIAKKLYDLYINFYTDLFDEIVSEIEFFQMIDIINNRIIYENFEENDTFSDTLKKHIQAYNEAVIQFSTNKKIEQNSNELLLSFNDLNKFLDVFVENLQIEDTDLSLLTNDTVRISSDNKRKLSSKILDISMDYFLRNGAIRYSTYLKFIYQYFHLCTKIEKRIDKVMLQIEKNKYLDLEYLMDSRQKKKSFHIETVKNGEEFERFLADLFIEEGYRVKMTRRGADQGADLILQSDSDLIAVQAKFYTGSVGNDAVQQVVASLKFYGAQYGMVITNSRFTPAAKELARANKVELIDGQQLEKLIEKVSSKILPKEPKKISLPIVLPDYSLLLEK